MLAGDLFPANLDLGAGQARGPGACQRPIGRKRQARPRVRPGRSALLELREAIAALRDIVDTQTGLLFAVGTVLEQVRAELRAAAGERRRVNERIEALLRHLVELRRGAGQVELHRPERHSRKRPLGNGEQ
jgi:hypothetical protein